MIKVFICYATEDSTAAMLLYYDLKRAHLDPWIDKKSLKGGQNWRVAIKQAIKSSRYFMPILSSRSIKKIGYVQAECKFALEVLNDFPEGEIYIIPIRLDDCEIPYDKLKNIQYVNMFPNWKDGLNSILQSIETESDEFLRTEPEFPSQQTGERINNEYETYMPSSDFDYHSRSEETKYHERHKDLGYNDEKEIKSLINTYKREPMFRENVLKKISQLCVNKKMYQSRNFMKFLRSIGKDENKHVILTFFSILHDLINISKVEDRQTYLNIQTKYKHLLLYAFSNWNERYTYSYSVIKDTLQILDLSENDWCRLHWKRVKNAILVGMKDLSKIYENISYLRDHCRPFSRYEKYLKKADGRIEIKNKIRSLLISG